MPSERVASYIEDILYHIRLTTSFVGNLTEEQFTTDLLRVYAVTRCLEIISEASRRLPHDLKARYPEIAWREMAGAGNIYRHDYDNVAARIVWETVRTALPPLRSAMERELLPDDR